MYIDYGILIGSQKGFNVSRLSPNVIFSDFVFGFEYFLKTIRLLETDFFKGTLMQIWKSPYMFVFI